MSWLFVVGVVDSNIISVPVFKILTSNGTVFLDHHLQTYHNWEKFIKENYLPKGLYAYPQDGIYQADDTGRVLLTICPSSCNSFATKAIIIGEIATNVISIAAVITSVLYAEAAPIALAIGAGCGLYRVIRGSLCIHNLRINKESLSLFDKTARGHWLSIIGSIIEVLTGLGSAGVAYLASKGESLVLAVQNCVKVFRASSVIVGAAGAIDNVCNVVMESGIVESIKQSLVNFAVMLVNSFKMFFKALRNKFARNSPQSYTTITVSHSFEEEVTEVNLKERRERDLMRRFEESTKEINFEMSEDLKAKLEDIVKSYFGSNKVSCSSALIRHSENVVRGNRSTTQEDCVDVYSLFLIYKEMHLKEMVRAYENKKSEKKKLLGENFDESLFDKEYGIQGTKSRNEWFEHCVMKKIENSSENLMEKFDLRIKEIIALNDDGGMKFRSSLRALKEFFCSSVIDGQELCPKEFFSLIRESIANEENCEIIQLKNGKIYSEHSVPVHIKVNESGEGSFFESVSFMN